MSSQHHRGRRRVMRMPSCYNVMFLALCCCLGRGQQMPRPEGRPITQELSLAAVHSEEARRTDEREPIPFAAMGRADERRPIPFVTMGRNEEGGPIPMLGMGLNEEREPISMLDMGESAPAPTSENIPWGRLQPARLKFLKHGTLAEKRLSAWQHWAAVTLTSMAIMVIAAHFVVCFRGMCSKGAGSSDLSAQPQQQQQLDSAGHATMAYGVPINGSYPLRTLISPGEGPTASVKGQGSSARGSKCGPNGGCKSGPRQQLQFDRFVVRGANTGPSAASAFGSKVLSVGGPHGYHKVNTWGYGGRYTPGLRGGYYYRHSYGMKDMFNIASGDDNEDDDYGSIEGRGTTAGEVYYGLDGRARVVQYPQTLVVPEDDETPEEFAARQKGRRTYEHCGGVTPAWLGR